MDIVSAGNLADRFVRLKQFLHHLEFQLRRVCHRPVALLEIACFPVGNLPFEEVHFHKNPGSNISGKVPGYGSNTIVVYTSDHGANFPFAKWTLYEEGIRVPFIVRWPGKVEPGSVTDAMVSFVDVIPTLMEAAGGRPPGDLDGRSFLDVLTGNSQSHRDAVFASHTGNGRNYPEWKANWSPMRAVCTRSHKYILNLNPRRQFKNHITGCGPNRQPAAYQPYWDAWVEKAKSDSHARRMVNKYLHRPVEELYDLRDDPYEMNNLASSPEHVDVLRSLRSRLASWRKKQGDTVPVHIVQDYEPPTR
ncbi:MAG: sulfatase/phosphatase domain-containing protein [Planctomycetota bacterium]